MNKRNYQLEMDQLISRIEAAGIRPGLLLHSCCAPCSAYVLEYLSRYFDITLYFCNPNIDSEEEYVKRAEELKKLVKEMPFSEIHGKRPDVVIADYDSESFEKMAEHLENEPERGERCKKCYELRLRKTLEFLKKEAEVTHGKEKPDTKAGSQLNAFCAEEVHLEEDRKYKKASKKMPLTNVYFATTLTLSPKKDAFSVNEIGERLADGSGFTYLPSDFKCRNGYERSYELSIEYGLYRQDYCGCRFSKRAKAND